MYSIINEINGYIKEANGNICLILVSTDKSKDTLKRYLELWNKIRDFIRLIANNSDNHNEKYMKIKINSDDQLPLKKK